MNTKQVYLVIALSVASIACRAQTVKPAIDLARDHNCESVGKAANYVSEKEHLVDQATVHADLDTLVAARRRVQETYAAKGFDNCASTRVTVLAWKEMRKDQPRGKLNEDTLVKLANEGFGGLKITSVPPGAAIKVDGKSWDDPTNTASWTHIGTRIIELSLRGYEDSKGEKKVTAGTTVEYKAKLSKKK